MTSPFPPRRRDTRSHADRLRQDRENLKRLGVGYVGGRFPLVRPIGSAAAAGDFEDDSPEDDTSEILFEYNDEVTATGPGTVIFSLSHEPIAESLRIDWHGFPQPARTWTVSGSIVTIPDPNNVIEDGDIFTATYAYYEGDQGTLDIRSADHVATVGEVVSVNVPIAETEAGDTILLAVARASAPSGWDLVRTAAIGATDLKVYSRESDGTETGVIVTGPAERMAGITVVLVGSSVGSSAAAVENPKSGTSFKCPPVGSGAAISFAMFDGPGSPPDEHITGVDTEMISNLNISDGIYGLAAATGEATFTSTTGDPTSKWLGVTIGVVQ